jgi:hypothetical protein
MFGQGRRERMKANAASASALALELAQDKKFRKRLLSALEHGSRAARHVRRGLRVSGTVARLANDQTLLRELRTARGDLQQAYERIERKRRSHKLRKAVILGLCAGLGVPQLRRRIVAYVGQVTMRGESGSSPGLAKLEELTKEELYERAQEADVPGRSEMSKDQLIGALRARRRPYR